jgi:predicted Na+-dependent transporter
MKMLLPAAVFMLMVSVGMSLSPRQLVDNWRRLTPVIWMKLMAATFLLPPLLALLLGHFLPLDGPTTAGLFLVSVVPGAPLMTRGVAKKGFDRQIAGSYQVWGALLTPWIIPLLIWGGGWLYGRDIWVSPMKLVGVVVQQQFAPLLLGMALMGLAPSFSIKAQRILNQVGNALLIFMLVLVLYKMGPTLAKASPWVALAAPILAIGCVLAVRLLLGQATPVVQTLSVCNANRHVGLALLLSGQHIQDQRLIPAIAAYALAAMAVMGLYAKLASRDGIESSQST